jgi:hypothetical protein
MVQLMQLGVQFAVSIQTLVFLLIHRTVIAFVRPFATAKVMFLGMFMHTMVPKLFPMLPVRTTFPLFTVSAPLSPALFPAVLMVVATLFRTLASGVGLAARAAGRAQIAVAAAARAFVHHFHIVFRHFVSSFQASFIKVP